MVAHIRFLGKGSSNLESQGKEGKEELLSASEIKRGWAQRRRDDVSVDVWDAGDVSVCVCPFVLAVFVRKGVCMAQGVCGVYSKGWKSNYCIRERDAEEKAETKRSGAIASVVVHSCFPRKQTCKTSRALSSFRQSRPLTFALVKLNPSLVCSSQTGGPTGGSGLRYGYYVTFVIRTLPALPSKVPWEPVTAPNSWQRDYRVASCIGVPTRHLGLPFGVKQPRPAPRSQWRPITAPAARCARIAVLIVLDSLSVIHAPSQQAPSSS